MRQKLATGRMTPIAAALPTVLLVAVAAIIPFVTGNSYDLGLYQVVLIFAIVAVGMNLSLGFGGEFVLGHVVAMGAAAYAAAWVNLNYAWGFIPSLVPALAIGTLVGVIIHLPGLRIMGWTLAIIGFVAVIAFADVIDLAQTWTGGEDGLLGLLLPMIGDHTLSAEEFYGVSLGVLTLVLVAVALLVHSSWGLRIKYLRDAPRALESVGVSVPQTKIFLYVASALPAAAAGWLTTWNFLYVAPSQFDFRLLTLLLAAVFIGGRGTLLGPLVGTLVVQSTSLLLGPSNTYAPLVFGLTLFLVVLILPAGLVPSLSKILAKGFRFNSQSNAPVDTTPSPPQQADRNGPSLVITGATKAFFGNTILRGFDMTIRAGRLTALVGPNGSGKTTVINLVTGFLAMDSGSIRLGQREITGESPVQVARAGVRRTFQVPQLSLSMSVTDNVATGLLSTHSTTLFDTLFRTPRFKRIGRERRRLVIRACTSAAVPTEMIDRPVSELSLAMRRQVEVARAVVGDSAVMLLDEPASGLNAEEVLVLADLLRSAIGPAVLVIEHNVAFVTAVANEIYMLDAGVCVAHADTDQDRPLPVALTRYMGTLSELEAETALSEVLEAGPTPDEVPAVKTAPSSGVSEATTVESGAPEAKTAPRGARL